MVRSSLPELVPFKSNPRSIEKSSSWPLPWNLFSLPLPAYLLGQKCGPKDNTIEVLAVMIGIWNTKQSLCSPTTLGDCLNVSGYWSILRRSTYDAEAKDFVSSMLSRAEVNLPPLASSLATSNPWQAVMTTCEERFGFHCLGENSWIDLSYRLAADCSIVYRTLARGPIRKKAADNVAVHSIYSTHSLVACLWNYSVW